MIDYLLRNILVNRKWHFLFFFLVLSCSLSAQDVAVSGTVTDDVDFPLAGVSVVVKGTANGTTTDFDGLYNITVSSNATLEFSYLGFVTQEIAVNGRTSINVSLAEDTQLLDEVVVVGYGSMERANVTGAITTVDVSQLEKTPVPDVVEALRGQVAGLRITKGNGQPGGGVSFTIRGINSLGEGTDDGNDSVENANQPIIVVDGVPLVNADMSEFNSDDIESINVLKDAAAASIYGSSGANGAILITTKSGKSGRTSITVKATVGTINVTSRLNMMTADQYLKYRLDAASTAGNTNASINSILDGNELANYIAGREIDWQDVLLKTGLSNNIGLSASGGTEDLHFYMNMDMYTEDGIVQNSDYKRYSIRFNGDYSPNDWLKIGARIQLTKSFADETANAITEFNQNGGFAPILPILINTPLGDIYDEAGELLPTIVDGQQFQINPLYRYKESVIDRFITRAYVNPYIDIKLSDDFTYTLNTYAEDRSQFYGRFNSSNYALIGGTNYAQVQKQSSVTYLLDNILNYKKSFGKHSINVTAVYGFQQNEFEQLQVTSEDLASDLLGYHGIDDSPAVKQIADWRTDEWGKVYLVGRVGYNYDSRYSLTATVRRDGSSKFGKNFKYGTFPSISGAWNIHNEKFISDDGVLDFLKLRLSYGELGNDRINTYGYNSNSEVVRGLDANGDEIVGYAVGNLPNPDLKWETSKQANIGLDFGFFNNRLTGSMDYFNTNTTDLLLVESIPVTNGASEIVSNVGETENSGLEIGLKGSIVQNKDFTWNVALNWAYDNNKVVSLTRGNVDAEGNPIDDIANGWFIGQDIRVLYNFEQIGIWQLGEETEATVFGLEPGDIKIRDVNSDGVINQEDRTFLGSPTPDWYGGIRNTFSYKGFELDVLLEAVQGITTTNNFYGSYSGRENEINIDYWTPTNPSNEFPAAGKFTGDFANAAKIQDASFVALRNISLSYSMPSKFLEKTPIKSLSFSLRGNNLKYWTDFTDAYSPEAGRGAYPITKTWTFGTKVSF